MSVTLTAEAVNVGGTWFSEDKRNALGLRHFLTNAPETIVYQPASCEEWRETVDIDGIEGASKFQNAEIGRLNRICWSLEHLRSAKSMDNEVAHTLPDDFPEFAPYIASQLFKKERGEQFKGNFQSKKTVFEVSSERTECEFKLVASGFDIQNDGQPDWLLYVSHGDVTGTYSHNVAIILSRKTGEEAKAAGFDIQYMSEPFVW